MKNRAKTISLLMAICMMITLLPAVAFAAGNEWVPGGNGMKYRYYDGNFDIKGTFDGNEKSTTYSDYGYRTYIRTGSSDYQVTAKPTSEMYTVGETGLQVGIDLSFGGSGQDSYVNIKYTVRNTTNAPITFALGSGADVKIGSDDSAVITPLDTCKGFKMVSDKSSDLDNDTKEYAQFNFFGSGEGVTDIDSYWYGAYSTSYINHWSGNYETAIFEYGEEQCLSDNIDSAATWRWDNETLEANCSREYTVAIGIGGKGSEEAVVDEAVIGGTVTGTCSNVDVKLKRLNGREYTATVTPVGENTNTWSYTAEVPRGQYNVVAKGKNAEGNVIVTVTKMVKLTQDISEQNIELPGQGENSIVENTSSAFNALVGGVDEIAAAEKQEEVSNSNNADVTVTLRVSDEVEDNEVKAIKEQTGDKVVDFVDISLLKQVDNGTPDDIGDENDKLLTIMLKYDTSRSGIEVYRYHDNGVEKLSADTDQGEYFWIGNGFIGIKANKFSTYAVAYTPATNPPPSGGAPGTVDPGTSSGGYSGPSIWYIGGNTFGTSTSQVPTSVEIDGVPVPFTMNGSNIVVGCVAPDADRIRVIWGNVSNSIGFTPDANATCAEISLPKTGDVSVMAFALMAVIAAAGAMGKK